MGGEVGAGDGGVQLQRGGPEVAAAARQLPRGLPAAGDASGWRRRKKPRGAKTDAFQGWLVWELRLGLFSTQDLWGSKTVS